MTPTFDIFEILLILAVALIVIGPEQMPTVIRAVAKVVRDLRAASNEVMRELTEALEEEPPSDKPKLSPPQSKPPEPSAPPEQVQP